MRLGASMKINNCVGYPVMPGRNRRMLHRAVKAFKRFQRRRYPHITEENDNGEWVFGGPFDRLCKAYMAVIEQYDPGTPVPETLIRDMLYVIARDSECSHLLKATLKYPQWFEKLCPYSVNTCYYNVRWQFAEQLGGYHGNSNIKHLLFCFIESGDEYTERMALQSMCEHFPERAEEYAVKFWDRNIYEQDEYQKIMALYVLHRIKSPLLGIYIEKSYQMDYRYLKEWADKYKNEAGL